LDELLPFLIDWSDKKKLQEMQAKLANVLTRTEETIEHHPDHAVLSATAPSGCKLGAFLQQLGRVEDRELFYTGLSLLKQMSDRAGVGSPATSWTGPQQMPTTCQTRSFAEARKARRASSRIWNH